MSNPSGSEAQARPRKKNIVWCNPLQCRCGNHRLPQRVVLAILLHLCLQNNFNTRVVLNVAIVEMVEPQEEQFTGEPACPQYGTPNRTKQGGQFPWPRQTKSLVLYAFYIGYAVSQLPGGWLADKFGGRWVIIITVFTTTLSTASFPFLVQLWGHIAAVALRFILGVSHGFTMPAVSSMVSTWFPPKERAMWGGISYAGTNLGTILGNVISGYLIHAYDGWPIAFYFWAGYSGCFFLLVLLLLFSFPDTHPFISEDEADYIRLTNAGNRSVIKRSMRTPWKAIFTNMPYWANIWAQFGHNYIYLTLITYLPTYMREILQFDIANDGFFAAIPFIFLWVMSLVYSFTSPLFIRCLSEQTFNKVLGAGSNVASAALVLGAVYAGCNRYVCISLYIISMIVKAFYYATLPVNINALSRNYGGTMFGICNAIGSLSGIIGNGIIGSIIKDRQIYEWQLAFWITMGIELATTLIFFVFGSVDRQEFDYDEDESRDT